MLKIKNRRYINNIYRAMKISSGDTIFNSELCMMFLDLYNTTNLTRSGSPTSKSRTIIEKIRQ